MIPDPERAADVFGRALDFEPSERPVFLAGACGNDVNLRRRVEDLLLAHDAKSGFLPQEEVASLGGHDEGSRVPQTITIDSSVNEAVGTLIDRYKLLEQLGEGGFGTVWAAEQREPVKRRVALKIIKLGMDTKQVVARFEAERQALALMDHPNIAKVLDAGMTETGRPYFVMELVRGIPITKYCDQEQLSIEIRLDLFIKACHAIQHAHQKGVIHRDIKPSNILVTLHDGEPVPKVIDFGIAKATQQELTEKTIYTQHHQFIGTPAYMSPEQAEMSGLDIDTRSDIYSLGVLLYELLTGATPFDAKELMSSGLDGMRKIIREMEPLRPSSRQTQQLETLKRSESKHSAIRISQSVIDRDLDWIVMKCLEKDRTRRYETANGLAADVKRHLQNEPVVARPASVTYRLQKTVRRNKGAFAASAAVVVSLAVGLAAAVWGLADVNRQRHIAEKQLERAIEAEQGTREALRRADEQTEATRRSLYTAHMNMAQQASENEFVGPLPEILNQYSPRSGQRDLRGFEWYYWWRQSHRYILSFDYGDAEVGAVAISPDGKTLAAGGKPRFSLATDRYLIKTWNVASGTPIATYPGHAHGVSSIVFSSDGQTMASAGDDGVIRLWDVETGTLRDELQHNNSRRPGIGLAFFPDGKRLASTSDTIRVWSVADGELQYESESDRYFGQLVVSPDGKMLAWRAVARQLEVWSMAATDGELKKLPGRLLLDKGIHRDAFSCDGEMLATSDWTATISLWDAANLNPIGEPLQGHANAISALRFFPDGTLASAAWDGKIIFWDTTVSKALFTLKVYNEHVSAMDLSQDGTTLATGAIDGTVKLWNLQTLRSDSAVLAGHDSATKCMAWTPDGRLLASGDYGGKIVVWDSVSEKSIAEMQHGTRCNSLCFLSDNKTLVSGGGDGVVRMWDVPGGQSRGELPQQDSTAAEPVVALAVSAQRGQLAALDKGGTVTLWDLQSKTSRRTPITGHAFHEFHSLAPLAFSPSGKQLATCDATATVTIWNVDSGEALSELPSGRNRRVYSVAIAPDGKMLAATAEDGTVTLWDVDRGEKLRVLQGPSTWVRSAAFSPDGARLASAGDDRMITIWDVVTGETTTRLKGHDGWVHMIGFSPDGNTIASTSQDGTVRLWRAATSAEVLSSRP